MSMEKCNCGYTLQKSRMRCILEYRQIKVRLCFVITFFLCAGQLCSGYAEDTFSILPVAGVHVNSDFYTILEYNDQIVLDTGNGWDSEDVLNPSVVEYQGTFFNYYSGWNGNVWRTGLAVSSDGESWNKTDGFLLDIREDYWDNTYIAANGSALVYDDQIYYYYQGTDAANGFAQIGMAVSSDGYAFIERSDYPVLSVGKTGVWDSNGVADPYVINYGGKLYMYYLGMDCLAVQRIGVAMSDDGINWVKYKNNPVMDVGVYGAFDENGLGEPSIVYKAPYFYMLYTGRNAHEQRNLGFAISKDGINWKKMNYQGIIDLSRNDWDNQVVCDTTLLDNGDGTISVWYGGGNVAAPAQGLNGKIGKFKISLLGVNDMTQFDANTWESEKLDVRDYIRGIHQIEGKDGSKYVWASGIVDVILKKSKKANSLVINGYIGMDLFEKAGINAVTLEYFVNEMVAGKLTVYENTRFTQVIDLSDLSEEYFVLRIQASDYVNLRNSGLGKDKRDLAWILNSIVQE